jgi:hypothetical protein
MNERIDTKLTEMIISLEEAENALSIATLEYCDPTATDCTDDNHYCPTCETHLEEDGECMNCHY